MHEDGESKHDVLLHQQRRARRPMATRPLRRSRDDRFVAGVCGGLASFLEAPPRAVRILWSVSLFPSIGMTGVAYLLMWWLVPIEPRS